MYIIHTLWNSCLNYKPVVLIRHIFTNYATVTTIQISKHFHNPLKKPGGFPGDPVSKESACNAGDPALILRWGRSSRGGNGNPSQYSYLGIPMDRGDWQATVHEIARVGHEWGLNLPAISSVQSLSRVQLCDPMNRSMPGLPVHHHLLEFTQTHVLRVGDAIQPSHPLSSPSPPAPNPSQHQSLFQWVNSSHEVAKVLEFQF